jgi:hypothetical protein
MAGRAEPRPQRIFSDLSCIRAFRIGRARTRNVCEYTRTQCLIEKGIFRRFHREGMSAAIEMDRSQRDFAFQ